MTVGDLVGPEAAGAATLGEWSALSPAHFSSGSKHRAGASVAAAIDIFVARLILLLLPLMIVI